MRHLTTLLCFFGLFLQIPFLDGQDVGDCICYQGECGPVIGLNAPKFLINIKLHQIELSPSDTFSIGGPTDCAASCEQVVTTDSPKCPPITNNPYSSATVITAQIGDDCIYGLDKELSKNDAKKFCTDNGLTLVDLRNEAKQKTVSETTGFSQHWMNLEKISGKWTWNVFPAVDFRWNDPTTDNTFSHAVTDTTTSGSKWTGVEDTDLYRPVCERLATGCPVPLVDECRQRFEYYVLRGDVGGRCVYGRDDNMKFPDAKAYCENRDSKLVWADSQSFIEGVKLITDFNKYWVGLEKIGDTWTWLARNTADNQNAGAAIDGLWKKNDPGKKTNAAVHKTELKGENSQSSKRVVCEGEKTAGPETESCLCVNGDSVQGIILNADSSTAVHAIDQFKCHPATGAVVSGTNLGKSSSTFYEVDTGTEYVWINSDDVNDFPSETCNALRPKPESCLCVTSSSGVGFSFPGLSTHSLTEGSCFTTTGNIKSANAFSITSELPVYELTKSDEETIWILSGNLEYGTGCYASGSSSSGSKSGSSSSKSGSRSKEFKCDEINNPYSGHDVIEGQVGGLCIYGLDHTLSFSDAKAFCEDNGLSLVSLPDPSKQKLIAELTEFSQHWMNVQKTDTGVWEWGDGMLATGNLRWEQPTDATTYDFAVTMTTLSQSKYEWKGVPGTAEYRPVCEGQLLEAKGDDICSVRFSTSVNAALVDDVCVYGIEKKMKYANAKETCENKGLRLVWVETRDKQTKVETETGLSEFWIGLEKLSDTWTWVSPHADDNADATTDVSGRWQGANDETNFERAVVKSPNLKGLPATASKSAVCEGNAGVCMCVNSAGAVAYSIDLLNPSTSLTSSAVSSGHCFTATGRSLGGAIFNLGVSVELVELKRSESSTIWVHRSMLDAASAGACAVPNFKDEDCVCTTSITVGAVAGSSSSDLQSVDLHTYPANTCYRTSGRVVSGASLGRAGFQMVELNLASNEKLYVDIGHVSVQSDHSKCPCLDQSLYTDHILCDQVFLDPIPSSALTKAKIGNKCVYHVGISKTYTNAKAFCVSNGLRLIRMENSDIRDAVVTLLGSKHFWVGLEKISGVWYWVGTTNRIAATADLAGQWKSGEPSSTASKIVAISMGGTSRNFVSEEPNQSYEFACEEIVPCSGVRLSSQLMLAVFAIVMAYICK